MKKNLSIQDLEHDFHNEMRIPDLGAASHRLGTTAKGFTIGKGKKLYWYITVTKYGTYMCYPVEGDKIGWPRAIDPETIVTIHF